MNKPQPLSLSAKRLRFVPVQVRHIPQEIRLAMKQQGKDYLSRNSSCPCGSRKRFKNCCMVGT